MSILSGSKGYRGRKPLSPEEFNRARGRVLEELKDVLERKNAPDRPVVSLAGQHRTPRNMDEYNPILDG